METSASLDKSRQFLNVSWTLVCRNSFVMFFSIQIHWLCSYSDYWVCLLWLRCLSFIFSLPLSARWAALFLLEFVWVAECHYQYFSFSHLLKCFQIVCLSPKPLYCWCSIKNIYFTTLICKNWSQILALKVYEDQHLNEVWGDHRYSQKSRLPITEGRLFLYYC